MVPLPNLSAWFVDKKGCIVRPWISFLQQFVQAPPPFLNITPDPSPFIYQASEPGTIAVIGGTVSQIDLIRGSDTLNVTGSILIPLSIADGIEITYSVLPIVTFIPSYGQNTTS